MTTGQLGNTNGGRTFTISGSFNQFAGGPYTIPDPGVYPTLLSWHGHATGGNTTARNYMWLADGTGGRAGTFVYSGAAGYTLTGTSQWWDQGSIAYRNNATGYSDGYIPGGTQVWIGVWVNNSQYLADGWSAGQSEIGTGGDGTFVYHDTLTPSANSFGWMAAYTQFNYATPVISSMSDTNIYAGEVVTLSGYAFNGATGVSFNGVGASSFSVNSNTQITVTVPNGVTAGNVTVSNAYGTGTGPAYTVVGGYVFRSGAWSPSQGVFVFRSGTWQPAQGVFVYRSGVWQPSQ